MNILFVHYGNFTSNSMVHIGPYAEELGRMGHNTAICMPWMDDTRQYYAHEKVPALSYAQALENPGMFDGQPPHILHAWTPREVVRRFCLRLLGEIPAKLIIHLEDNEWVVAERARTNPRESLFKTHPHRGPEFLQRADAVTVIIETLEDQIPDSKPRLVLKPGIDLSWLDSTTEPPLTRKLFGIPPSYKILVYPGSSTGANRLDLENLYRAVGRLNKRGTPCILIKTGIPDAEIRKKLSEETRQWIRDIGFIDRNLVPKLIRLADCVVQPGASDSFNRYRLPSKLPEFLCLGMPVITTAVNLGEALQDGLDAKLLYRSTPEEIADRCQEVFADPKRSKSMADEGRKFGRRHFDLRPNSENLLAFYAKLKTQPPNPFFTTGKTALPKKPARLPQYPEEDRPGTASPRPAADQPDEMEPVELQIYFPNRSEFLEISSLRRRYSPETRVSLTFPFHPPEDLDWLRIDPGQFPGEYIIHEWSLLRADHTPALYWQNTYPPDPTVSIRAGGTAALESKNSTLSVISSGGDPQACFSGWPKNDFSGICWLRVSIEARHLEVKPDREPDELLSRPDWLVEPYWKEV